MSIFVTCKSSESLVDPHTMIFVQENKTDYKCFTEAQQFLADAPRAYDRPDEAG